ncbi:CBS domain-containing protein [Pseudomonas neustonica]|uniref:CBS domain-containing protein n=1 Tax=Pseudomonas neustonica TaxID=2487346 RepID=A0ABX9XQS7_9PSED|nr:MULTISPECIES: CBS domain-containing protein [Pseudomonas]MBA6419249.1 CBS domain-containing protein [Pseudomonas sp. 5Ae-yellow]ROZ86976.1 CBS domain-containing protein [Pseudomonas sp. SSM44]ROZ88408.1 CBS domain-containing protein [Pseudomonas neustonica]|tara:strand:- start:16145 stop:16558 length:414 start_codon:yes stop_codon:yes gene_type:complete
MLKSIKVRDYMTSDLVTFTADMDLFRAIDRLLVNQISGAPVLDEHGNLVGLLSEGDCLKGILAGSYFEEVGGTVASVMTVVVETIDADADIVKAAEHFIRMRRRRLPVIDEGRLVGQISRRDILRAMQKYNEHAAPK